MTQSPKSTPRLETAPDTAPETAPETAKANGGKANAAATPKPEPVADSGAASGDSGRTPAASSASKTSKPAAASKKTKPATKATKPATKASKTSKKAQAESATTAEESAGKSTAPAKDPASDTPAAAAKTPDSKTRKEATATPMSALAPVTKVAADLAAVESEAVLSGLDCGAALYSQSLGHLQRTAASLTRYCTELAGAQSGMDVLQAHEAFMRERYDDIARDSIAAATLLLEAGSEATDRLLSGR